jgi:aminoglycoside 3-N-acetyltransferase I
MNLTIKHLKPNDLDKFIDLIRLFEAVFEMEDFLLPERKHLQNLLNQPSFHVFAALVNGEIVGGVTAYSMTQYYSTRDAVFLYDLAVASSMQRQGVGKKLMVALNDHCKTIGTEVVFLEADETDQHAIEFYRSTGAQEERGYFFSYPLNP